jgi:hypothetical protein
VTIKDLNRSAASRYIFNQSCVISAIPGIALGLKAAAYLVAIPEYSVAHDALLPEVTLSISVGSEVVPSDQSSA